MKKAHVHTFQVMSPGPDNFIVTATTFDVKSKKVNQVRSKLLSQKQAKKLEKALRMAIENKVITAR